MFQSVQVSRSRPGSSTSQHSWEAGRVSTSPDSHDSTITQYNHTIQSYNNWHTREQNMCVCVAYGVGIGLEGLIARLCSRVVTGRDTWNWCRRCIWSTRRRADLPKLELRNSYITPQERWQ